ncbi:unnamed protein product [Closterium sp. NIES-53]
MSEVRRHKREDNVRTSALFAVSTIRPLALPHLPGYRMQHQGAIRMSEVKRHKKEEDAWTVVRGRVYNITPYLDFHPGGKAMLMKAAGKDCTALFSMLSYFTTTHSSFPLSLSRSLSISFHPSFCTQVLASYMSSSLFPGLTPHFYFCTCSLVLRRFLRNFLDFRSTNLIRGLVSIGPVFPRSASHSLLTNPTLSSSLPFRPSPSPPHPPSPTRQVPCMGERGVPIGPVLPGHAHSRRLMLGGGYCLLSSNQPYFPRPPIDPTNQTSTMRG